MDDHCLTLPWRPQWTGIFGMLLLGAIAQPAVASDGDMPVAFSRSLERYEVPAVTLVNQNNKRVELNRVLSSDRPAMLEFFFTTCTTICAVRSARLAPVEADLARDRIDIDFVSISVDPEFDTPKHLREYATRCRPLPHRWFR